VTASHKIMSGPDDELNREINRMRGRDHIIGAVAEAQSLGIRNDTLADELVACRSEREQAISDMKASLSWRIGRSIMSPALALRRLRRTDTGGA
jgi:hypothetical protein